VTAGDRLRRVAVPAASLVVGALLWEIVGRNTSPAFMVPLSVTVAKLVALVKTGEFMAALAQSLALFMSGFLIAVVTAVPLGVLFARVRLLRIGLESYVTALYATPMAALIPFILSLFGFDFGAKILVVFLFAFFPILYNTVEGARSVRPELIEVARAFRSNEWGVWRDVLIPHTLPFALTGVRQGIGRGLVGMVTAEFFLSASGIGRLIIVSERDFDTAGVLAAVLLITLLGVLLMAIGRAMENRYAAWRGLDR
jgi:ABC-type nitrate/sulfonate/bicarbonate transport system permease component